MNTHLPILDAHLDLAWNAIGFDRDLTRPVTELRESEAGRTDHPARGRATVCLPELERAGVRVCLATILARVRPGPGIRPSDARLSLDSNHPDLAWAAARGQLAYYEALVRRGDIAFIRDAAALADHWERAGTHGRPAVGIILAMEGADPVLDPAHLADWHALGLRVLGPVHYGQGRYAAGTGTEGGFTAIGRELLAEMERLGIVLDTTHLADVAFEEALDRFGGPAIASHCNTRHHCPDQRQLSDEQIRRLAARDAVIGLSLDTWQLVPDWHADPDRARATLETAADHVEHVCQVAGTALHCGIGSDLDGGYGYEQCPAELDTIADMQKLAPILAARGYGDDEIAGIFHGNFRRVLAAALPG